jgi:8-oxo-dGTP diphosphatase
MNNSTFNIRVYGLLIHNSSILIAEQLYRNMLLRKFPGGGLNYGEGIIDCLKREFVEELQLDIEVVSHYYTTDFFVQSIFQELNQVISIYYKVRPAEGINHPLPAYNGLPSLEGDETFRWVAFSELAKEEFLAPIESRVAEMLYDDYIKGII